MQCKCGGATKTLVQPKVRKKVQVAVAELVVCEACGRNAGPVKMWLTDHNGNKTRQVSDETLQKVLGTAKARPAPKSRRQRRTRP